jgi:hypothetical protein
MNYIAIVGVAVLAMVMGAIWYGPFLFGKQWMKLMWRTMVDKESKKNEAITGYVVMFIWLLVTWYVVARLIGMLGISNRWIGAKLWFLLRLGITLPVLVGTTLWEWRKRGLFKISAGYQLLVMIMMGMILAVW